MTLPRSRFLAAVALSAALLGCGSPTPPAAPPTEEGPPRLTVPAFTPDPLPMTAPAATPDSTPASESTPNVVPDEPAAARRSGNSLVDPRLLVNGMAFGSVVRPRQTYDLPAFNTPQMQALLKPPAKSFTPQGIHDGRKIEQIVALATLDESGRAPNYLAIVQLVDKASGDELEQGPINFNMTPDTIGERTIWLQNAPSLPQAPDRATTTIEKAATDAPAVPDRDDNCQDAPAPNADGSPANPAESAPLNAQPDVAGELFAIWRVDDVTFVAAPRRTIEALMQSYDAGAKGDDELIRLLQKTDRKADADFVLLKKPLEKFLVAAAKQLPEPPPELADLAKLPELVDSALLTISINPEPKITFVVDSPDAAAAKRVAALLELGLQQIAPAWEFEKQLIAKQVTNEDLQPAAAWLADLVQQLIQSAKVTQADDETTLAYGGIGTLEQIVVDGSPHLHKLAEYRRRSAEIAEAMNNLKQLGIAMHAHHDAFKKFPAAQINDASGKPLLSWRVAILPLVEQGDLAREFKLDEPWDSEHNKKLIGKMPSLYRSPGVVVPAGKTLFLLPVGPQALFHGAESPEIKDVTDGLSNTLMIVEGDIEDAVTWTKPDDLPLDLNSLPKLGDSRKEGFLAVFADGAVNVLPQNLAPDLLRALFTPAGAEPIDAASLYGPANSRPAPPTAEAAPNQAREESAAPDPQAPKQ